MTAGSQRGQAPRAGKHLQFPGWGFPRERAAPGRGCHGMEMGFASSWHAARKREQSWDPEEQIKAVRGESWQG